MSRYVQIKGQESMVRDLNSKAILNTDSVEYINRVRRKRLAAEQRLKIAEQQQTIESLSKDLADIKSLVNQLLLQQKGEV